MLNQPIIILGSARSGTTVLSKILSQHPDLAYIEEPNLIWRYRNAKLHSDYFPEHLATDKIIKYINNRFVEYVNKSGKKRLLEKTPANTMRLAFVRKVLPNSKIIHLIRDGRDVTYSASRKWLFEEDKNKYLPGEKSSLRLLKKQIQKIKQVPLCDFPYYQKEILSAVLYHFGAKKRIVWGPRFPGIRDYVKVHTVPEVCALQWKASIELVLKDRYKININDYFELTYEDLCSSPLKKIKEILDFLNLSIPSEIDNMANLVNPISNSSWEAGFSEEEKESINDLIGDTLTLLGYR